MGCCASKQQDLYIDVPRAVSTTDTWALRQKSFVGGCQLLPFTAGCPASYPYQSLTRVVLGDGHLFAALWEGHGGSQAARHCVSHCYETLLQCLQSNPDPCWSLRQSMQLLDKSYLGSQDLPETVKAGVGATGLMLFINTRTNQCCVARLGDSIPFVTESKGSFNTTSVEVKYLSSHKPHKGQLGSHHQQAQSSRAAAYTLSDGGPVTYTHAVGFGYGKSAKLQKAWLAQHENPAEIKQQLPQLPFVSNSCEVTMSQLTSTDETLVLASEGLLQVLAPQEVGLLLHHFNAAKLTALRRALAAAAVQQEATTAVQGKGKGKTKGKGKGSKELKPDEATAAAGKAARHPNVANIVMHHAIMKALDKHNLAVGRKEQLLQQHTAGNVAMQPLPKLSYDELMHLPLVVDTEAFRPPGATGNKVQLHLPKHYPTDGLHKKDVHSDMGLVVLSLNWPRPQDSQLLPGMSPQRPGRATIRPDAQYRWQLLRLAVKFHMAYRRALRSRWWKLLDAVESAAAEAARQAEVQAWKVMGAAVKVNLAGDVLAPEAPMRLRHSPAKASTQLSPKKRPSGTMRHLASSSVSSSISSAHGLHAPPPAPAASPAARMSVTPQRSAVAASTPPPPAAAAPQSAVTPVATPPVRGSSLNGGAQKDAVRSSVGSSSRAVPARLEISFEQDLGDNESDIESPSRLDSPSKASKSAFASAAAARPAKKSAGGNGSSSPTKPYKKDNLSLRGPRTTASPQADVAAVMAAEASWGTGSRVSTPGQLRASAAVAGKGSSSGGSSSPAKGPARGTPPAAGVGSSRVDDHCGYQASGCAVASGGSRSSPTKLSRGGKLSLRKPAAHY